MLASLNRLPKDTIPLVLRRGTRMRDERIELIYQKSSGAPRFAFIVSAKIGKRAVVRNRMRRTMSESVRLLLPAVPSIDGILVAKKNFADLPQPEVEKIIASLLHI